METKTELRRRALAARATLTASQLAKAAHGLRDVLLAAPELHNAVRVAAYVSVGREPGTGPLLDELQARGVEVLLPVLLPDWELDWAPYEGAQRLASAPRGLLEPMDAPLGVNAIATVDVVLAPGLAVDRYGTRLGKGAGCYDRALSRAAPGAFTCVLLHDNETVDAPLPREAHDVPVRAVATPSALYHIARLR